MATIAGYLNSKNHENKTSQEASTASTSATSSARSSSSGSVLADLADPNLDRRVAEARASLATMMANMSNVRKDCEAARETNQRRQSASEELDAKWEAFKASFDEMNKKLIGAIAGSIGAEGLAGGIGGRPNLAAIQEDSSWYEEFDESDRKAVFGGQMNVKGLAKKIKDGSIQNIVIMCGAGISVSAGIPDFRSKNGLYEKLKKEYNMENPQLLFDISYFQQNPTPFAERALEMLPGKFRPTKTHHFLNLLRKKQLLQRVYTQNIDTLEKLAGLPDEDVVYSHGSFADVHCIACKKRIQLQTWRNSIEKKETPKCDECAGLVKPDIVFFGEDLPQRFARMRKPDFKKADCLIVLGTSLKVSPFNTLISLPMAKEGLTPRVLINNESVGTFKEQYDGFRFGEKENFRDLFLEGSCDKVIEQLCKELGWSKEIEELEKKDSKTDGWKLMVDNQPKTEEEEMWKDKYANNTDSINKVPIIPNKSAIISTNKNNAGTTKNPTTKTKSEKKSAVKFAEA